LGSGKKARSPGILRLNTQQHVFRKIISEAKLKCTKKKRHKTLDPKTSNKFGFQNFIRSPHRITVHYSSTGIFYIYIIFIFLYGVTATMLFYVDVTSFFFFYRLDP